ncbi:hypothetical protein KM295_16200 [Natronomonas sp. F2-12]|uniref:Uncharacterized protein n=1 Tax=Natronomonas aquatica TaxID=2841590 RepID=A0A9R1D638_9EURY|nr:hypothetical protein [Natronomonas aquatica]MCQ4334994.1 hypothetical protein [Natronomonas aquatica]
MGDPWFTTSGEVGELEIERNQDGWVVAANEEIGRINCLIQDQSLIDETADEQTLTVRIENFRKGLNKNPNFLTITPLDSADMTSSEAGKISDKSESAYSQSPSQNAEQQDSNRSRDTADNGSDDFAETTNSSQPSSHPNETWDLAEFSGSGEYVNVEAKIDSIHWVKKDEPRIPDIRGELRDESVLEAVTFVIRDGVSHPRMDRGKRYRFENVKDHYYKENAEVQVVITQYTNFTDLG